MPKWIERLHLNKTKAFSIVFLMMVLPPLPMFIAAQTNRIIIVWLFLGIVIIANFVAILIQ